MISLPVMVALGRLNEHHREVLVDRVLVGLSLQTIADRDGVTRQRVGYVEKLAATRLQFLLATYRAAA